MCRKWYKSRSRRRSRQEDHGKLLVHTSHKILYVRILCDGQETCFSGMDGWMDLGALEQRDGILAMTELIARDLRDDDR